MEISHWKLMWEVETFHTLGNCCFKLIILHWGILYERKIHLNDFYSSSISNMLLQVYMKSEN